MCLCALCVCSNFQKLVGYSRRLFCYMDSNDWISCLRLTDYQVLWETETWICQIIAYIAFHVGANLGIHFGGTWFVKIKSKNSESEESLNNKDTFRLHGERLFPICVILTIFGIACFVINICIRGYIPFFAADGNNAYIRFYTKWYFLQLQRLLCLGWIIT